jgi:circadian clock protein KaiC
MLIRLVDFLKANYITGLFLYLSSGASVLEATESGMSSLMDTWILLRDIEVNGERNRGIYVLKSRGMKHSNQIREFLISPEGVKLQEVYLGSEGVLTGSARLAQETRDKERQDTATTEAKRRAAIFERKKRSLEAQVAALQAEIEAEELALLQELDVEKNRRQKEIEQRADMAKSRRAKIEGTRGSKNE